MASLVAPAHAGPLSTISPAAPHTRRLPPLPSQKGRNADAFDTLSNKGRGGGALVPPGGRQDTDGLVVARQAVNARLDENQTELGVLVLAVALEVLADSDSLE